MSEISLLPGGVLITSQGYLPANTPPSTQFPLSPSHRNLSPPLPTANRPRLHLGLVLSVPAPTSGFLALPQGSERPIGALPLCIICIGAKLLYRFGSVGRGHSVVGGRSGCHRSSPLAVTRPGEAGSVRPRCSFALAGSGAGWFLFSFAIAQNASHH